MIFRNKDGKTLEDLAKKIGELPGRVSLPEVFDDEFMAEHTDSPSLQAFLDSSGIDPQDAEQFKAMLENPEFDAYVAKHTKFLSWIEMRRAAFNRLMQSRLEL
jgi:hypothetical protein